ncbi:hypothetical protein CAEBREN_15638 [Caenorhabditis brenneri]|uniref:Uncharacterized protein n=1 Tax=Caenorhabditis brenneri TaxID=135651 RepID=G0NJ38_CAEBE|nr:hypothetical protein CAEBREN_15638 [Caenorhabditis brenneri]
MAAIAIAPDKTTFSVTSLRDILLRQAPGNSTENSEANAKDCQPPLILYSIIALLIVFNILSYFGGRAVYRREVKEINMRDCKTCPRTEQSASNRLLAVAYETVNQKIGFIMRDGVCGFCAGIRAFHEMASKHSDFVILQADFAKYMVYKTKMNRAIKKVQKLLHLVTEGEQVLMGIPNEEINSRCRAEILATWQKVRSLLDGTQEFVMTGKTRNMIIASIVILSFSTVAFAIRQFSGKNNEGSFIEIFAASIVGYGISTGSGAVFDSYNYGWYQNHNRVRGSVMTILAILLFALFLPEQTALVENFRTLIFGIMMTDTLITQLSPFENCQKLVSGIIISIMFVVSVFVWIWPNWENSMILSTTALVLIYVLALAAVVLSFLDKSEVLAPVPDAAQPLAPSTSNT